MRLRLANGDGTFGTKRDYATGDGPCSVAIGDLNGDGKPDLAVVDSGSNTLSSFLGRGDGTFAIGTNLATGLLPQSMAIGDLNGDGKADLVVVNNAYGDYSDDDSVAVRLGHGDGTFGPARGFSAGSYSQFVAIGDLNGDGIPDLAVANSDAISVLLGNGDGANGDEVSILLNSTPALVQPKAAALEDGILVSWTVTDGAGLTGFNLYRRIAGSPWVRIAQNLPSCGESCSYLDTRVEAGLRYDYEVEATSPGGSAGRSGPVSAEAAGAPGLAVHLLPNPGRDLIHLFLAVPDAGDVVLRLYDIDGREVAQRSLRGLRAGVSQEAWTVRDRSGRPLSSGGYYLRMEVPSGHATASWIVVR